MPVNLEHQLSVLLCHYFSHKKDTGAEKGPDPTVT